MMMRTTEKNKVRVSRFHNLSECRDIIHFTTMRSGGVSQGSFASMNPSIYTEDDPGSVRENLALLAAELGIAADSIWMPRQVHTDQIVCLDDSFFALSDDERIDRLQGVDALITDRPGVCVAVSTADCVPVLLYAPDQGVVAAVHAGWRGTVLRIARQTALQMISGYGCDPEKLIAGIGPSIGQAAFEVGEEVVAAFESADMPMNSILKRHPVTQKAHIDLWEANRWQLCEAGLRADRIEVSGICTYTSFERYFSARRLGIRSGRILTGIQRLAPSK